MCGYHPPAYRNIGDALHRIYVQCCHPERPKGVEPSPQAWEARILPLNYGRCCFILAFFMNLIVLNLVFKYFINDTSNIDISERD